MVGAADSGRFVSGRAARASAPVPVATNAVLVRLAGVRDVVGVVRDVVVLPLVGLLVGLILITAGCGPPS